MLLLCVTEAERLRREVVADIRSNQSLEEDLNQMDIKIGLLVKNRITLQVRQLIPIVAFCGFVGGEKMFGCGRQIY